MHLLFVLLLFLQRSSDAPCDVYLPVHTVDRHSSATLRFTTIGLFGMERKARPTVPAHLHAGIDICRPSGSSSEEPVYPMAKGTVISKRDDGPYAQLIIEHALPGGKVWSLYEHVAGIRVGLQASVDPMVPIARFLNAAELRRYGQQFDHLHFEILKAPPIPLGADRLHPERRYNSFSLFCHTRDELFLHYYDPGTFFEHHCGGGKGR